MSKVKFPAHIWLDDEGFFQVEFPDVRGAITYGDTLEEAKAMASEALTGILETKLDHREPIPRPPQYFEQEGVYWIGPEANVVTAILLRWAREDAHMTQAELATKLGVTHQAVQKLERSNSNPSVKTLAKVARALGRELDIAI